ncbi:MAG: gamma-glutamyl-gamma-aminobutyrate hydrolase family protein [Betaproteobacteria bacterium]|nr:MAG: gamma-glutamyl-gamma-aminobutyrate hydrolase family protein [Betaproteobacteria bacterium]
MTRIGVSPRLFHPEPGARGVHTKLLDYLEHSVADWIGSRGALVFLLPLSSRAADYAASLDGLVLQGGADISPRAYGEEPQKREWAGDEMRDRYEVELVRSFEKAGKPVLGICRGAQLINVALGGSLHQDVPAHRTEDYDLHAHDVRLEPGSGLARLYGETGPRRVVSIHHQAIKRLGRGLRVEARSEPDGLIEAIRGEGANYVCAVQWHPEFHNGREGFLDGGPLLDEFLQAARK